MGRKIIVFGINRDELLISNLSLIIPKPNNSNPMLYRDIRKYILPCLVGKALVFATATVLEIFYRHLVSKALVFARATALEIF